MKGVFYLVAMNRNQTLIAAFILLLGIAGLFIAGWWGGFLTGACAWSLLLLFIGKKVAASTARKIDKNIRDIIVNQT